MKVISTPVKIAGLLIVSLTLAACCHGYSHKSGHKHHHRYSHHEMHDGHPMKTAVFSMIQRFDTDGNGAVTLEEFRAGRAKDFAEADTNNDSLVSKEELKAHIRTKAETMLKKMNDNHDENAPPALIIVEKQMKHRDSNKDGSLSREEFVGNMFKRFDSNSDGMITGEDRPSPPMMRHRMHHRS